MLLTLLAGACLSRVGQRAARSLPERRPAKFRRVGYSDWYKVANARTPNGKGPGIGYQGLPRPCLGQGGVSFPKQSSSLGRRSELGTHDGQGRGWPGIGGCAGCFEPAPARFFSQLNRLAAALGSF
jgi:hypothetical protein